MKREIYQPLPGIHVTPAPFLDPPSPTFAGWVRSGPYDYLVHPQAMPALIAAVRASLAPREVIVVPPSESARLTLASVRARRS